MKTAFLVLGAQRSGTSATSHVLSRFGINFGGAKNFIQADHNPTFFELSWVNQCNNQLINALGYRYTDLFLPAEIDFERADISQIEEDIAGLLEGEWGESPLIGIKDPRLSLTLPVWERILLARNYKLNIVISFRAPSSFLKSNSKLFYRWDGWTNIKHLKFWLQLNLSAVYFTRRYSVHYINYDALMSDSLQEAEKLASRFCLNPALATHAALAADCSYYHYKSSAETGFSFVDRYYELLCFQAQCERSHLLPA